MTRLVVLAALAIAARGRPAAAHKDEHHVAAETEGLYIDRRRAEVPDPDVALHERRTTSRIASTSRACRPGTAQPRGRRDVVRRLDAGPERDATRRCRRPTTWEIHDTQGNGLPPDPDRHEHQPVRVPEGDRRAARRPSCRCRAARPARARSRARCCSSRSRPTRSRTARSSCTSRTVSRARPASTTSTSSTGIREYARFRRPPITPDGTR